MITCHQNHNLPWKVLIELDRSKSKKEKRLFTFELSSPLTDRDKKLVFFFSCLKKTITEFADTESKKYNRAEVDAIKQLYPDNAVNSIFLKEFQTGDSWKKWLNKNRSEIKSSAGGELCDIIKELFNHNMMAPLLYIARNIPGVEDLSFVTYSNFFHYGFRRVLEDAMICYFFFNYEIVKNNMESPEIWPEAGLKELTFEHDHDASKLYYRKMIGNYENDIIPLENIIELGKFSFRCIYQYELFWNEICEKSGAAPIDWLKELWACLERIFYEIR